MGAYSYNINDITTQCLVTARGKLARDAVSASEVTYPWVCGTIDEAAGTQICVFVETEVAALEGSGYPPAPTPNGGVARVNSDLSVDVL